MLFSHSYLCNYYSYGDSGFLTFESSTSLHSTMNTPVNVKTRSNSNINSVVWMSAAIPIKTVHNIGQQNMLHQSYLIANNFTSHWQHCQWLSQAVEGIFLGPFQSHRHVCRGREGIYSLGQNLLWELNNSMVLEADTYLQHHMDIGGRGCVPTTIGWHSSDSSVRSIPCCPVDCWRRRISMFLSNFHSSWTKPALYHLWGFVLHSEFGQLVLMCCGFWEDLQHYGT